MSDDSPESPVPLAEISHGPGAFEQFLDNNQKNLIILTVLLVIGAAALVVYRGIEKSRQETAGAALNKAADLAALQAVTQEHADTRAALSATVLLADRQWSEGQQDAAIATLQGLIDSNPAHPVLPGARASLGAKLMAQGKSADATTVFQAIVDDPEARFIAPFALISLGDIAKVAGDLDKADLFYNRVKKDFADSSFSETANLRIIALKAKPPVEVDPPPAPVPPAETPAPEAPAPGQESSPEIRSESTTTPESPVTPEP
ncbi:MAG: tetratricopeptide repeat protein [Luteolibacter sp.]|jgi:hypothetical protein|nr:tetratricopeptide repeat protein [Luteolibacter sp.]